MQRDSAGNIGQYKEMVREIVEEHERKPNPVTQRVKILMVRKALF